MAQAAATSAQRAADAAPKMITALVEGLGRLPLLLQRLETFAPPAAASNDGASTRPVQEAAPAAPVHGAVVADAILEASLRARDGAELQKYLDHIRGLGIVGSTDEMFRALGRSVSGWSLAPWPRWSNDTTWWPASTRASTWSAKSSFAPPNPGTSNRPGSRGSPGSPGSWSS